jgi:hypothetical protein
MKKLIVFVFLAALASGICAQDLIVKTDSTKIEVKITEVSEYEIKYYEFDNLTGPVFILGVDKIAFIKYANGKVSSYKGHVNSISTDIDAASINKRNILKISPFSPITGHLDFEYERVFSKRMSCLTELGIIGVNANEEAEIKGQGAFLSGGVRLYRGKEVRHKNTYYNNNFSGFYVQAKLGLEAYKFDFEYETYEGNSYKDITRNERAVGGSFMLGFGMQWIFAGRVSVDLGGAFGYVFVNDFTYSKILSYPRGDVSTTTVTNSLYHTGNFGNEIGIAGDGWVRVGFIF